MIQKTEDQITKQELKVSESKQRDCWTNTQIQNLVKAMPVYFCDLDDYGKGINFEMLLNKYRFYFEKKYSTEEVINAIHQHCKISGIVPKVCDLVPILSKIHANKSMQEDAEMQRKIMNGEI